MRPEAPDEDRSADERAFDAYLAAAEAGCVPSVAAFLADHPTASDSLAERLEELRRGLEARPDAVESLVGERLGSYQVLARLGAGGMGEVYRARDDELDREVAIKVLPPGIAASPESLQRFRREARLLAALNHANIATIHGLGHTPAGAPFLVMELVRGADLRERLRTGPLAMEEAIRVAARVAGALESAHRRGILHRDLKPANVMLGEDDSVKLLDFGLARRFDEEEPVPLSTPGVALGTPGYMSPEQAMGLELDVRSDAYAFGCLLHECLTGERWGSSASPPASPEPAPELRALIRRCLAVDVEQRLGDLGEARRVLERLSSDSRSSRAEGPVARPSLPTPLARFVGRERELVEVEQLMSERRLVTLCGPGGTGKSRLAIELAGRHAGSEVWFAPLAPLRSEEAIPSALALAAGMREERGREVMDTLLAAAAERSPLIVLDNCEHLLESAADVALVFLRETPGVRVLTTSREPLAVSGEQVFAVPPLSVPQLGADPAAIVDCDAVRLFVDRARLADHEFRLDPASLEPIAELCRRLDGLPLALELAASRARVLSIEQLCARLDDALGLLRGGDRSGPSPHHTLRATIDWSHDLLEPQERALFRRLAVFEGGWTLEAAETVCAFKGLARAEVFEQLSRLVERSLVVATRARGAMRYRFLETLRQYARERLAEAGELQPVRVRHAEHYLSLGVRAGELKAVSERGPFYTALDPERDNLDAALGIHHEQPEYRERVLRAAIGLVEFWMGRGFLRSASARMEESIEAAERCGDDALLAEVLRAAGIVAHRLGQRERAEQLALRSLEAAKRAGDELLAGRAERQLGFLYCHTERFEEAQPLLESALSKFRGAGQEQPMALLLNDLGILAVYRERYEEAERRYTESLCCRRAIGDAWGVASSLGNLGEVATRQGRFDLARERLNESLLRFHEIGDKRSVAESFEMSAALEARTDRARRAGTLAGAAEALREAIDVPVPPAELAAYQRDLKRASDALGASEYDAARLEGRALELDAAVTYALEGGGAPA